jgi:hypothetical protein
MITRIIGQMGEEQQPTAIVDDENSATLKLKNLSMEPGPSPTKKCKS